MRNQSNIRNIIEENNMLFKKTINRKNSSVFGGMCIRTEMFNQNKSIMYEYIMYVRKMHYDKAVVMINYNYNR